MNPTLPLQHFVPDAEARVWQDGRLYVYGSCDISGNTRYCSKHYRVYSTSDLVSWTDHGSIHPFNGRWYVLYHRSSHASRYSRRLCIEPITINADGSINEVEMTSQDAGPAFVAGQTSGWRHFEAFPVAIEPVVGRHALWLIFKGVGGRLMDLQSITLGSTLP